MVDKCSSPNMSYEKIVDAFACIGETAKTSKEASLRVGALNDQLADQFGIDKLQASIFSSRILDYVPRPGSTASQIHQDLVAEMRDVVTSPQTRNPVNDTTPTGIPGIDRLREMGAGIYINAQAWPRNEAGEQIIDFKSPWPRNEVGNHMFRFIRRVTDPAEIRDSLKKLSEKPEKIGPAEVRKLLEELKAESDK